MRKRAARFGRAVVLAAAVTGATLAMAGGGTVHDVGVGPGMSFFPSEITIEVGDTVRWTWKDQFDFHNVVSGVGGNHDGNFNSGPPTNEVGHTFEVTFDQAFLDENPMPDNHYPYYCEPHLPFGMTGSVTVEPGAPCPEDLNGDGMVGVPDLLVLINSWGICDVCGDCPADFTGDCNVGVQDLLVLIGAWGACPN